MSERLDLSQLFEQARELPPDARQAFLEDIGRDDGELRRELESLLEHADAGERFFQRLGDVVTSSSLTPTLRIGRYEILSCIGVGGMGAVYRARDTRLERDVALKFLPAHRGAEALLLMEARTAAALDHVNVCTVHEIGETDDGRSFIAMALYDGETLRERIRKGPLPIDEALDITQQIARGLGAAHARGIVHRDIKPGNVMLTEGGTVKLLDFGLAGIADAGVGEGGVTPGTLAYMSPEQIRGESVGAWSDLWSVGVVAYEMLTGTHPFSGHDANAVRHAILVASPVPISKVRPDVPAPVERLVSRLLAPDPATRYSSDGELSSQLERVRTEANGRTRRRRNVMALAGALVVVLAMGALWREVSDRPKAPAATAGVGGDVTLSAARSVAVLPFANVGRDPDNEYLSDGLTEELISTLAKVSAVRVVARTSAFVFKGENRDVREIGRALDVSTILEGSVQRVGDRIRVRAQLVNVADGLHLWSETYERALADVFAIQSDLATRIATALEAKLTSGERERLARRETTNPEAFTLYLKGRHFFNQRTASSYPRAIEYFERAIAADPRYAAPHAGLAAAYSLQGVLGILTPAETQRRMKAAALRALELDSTYGEAHSVLGAYWMVYEGNRELAEREHRQAIALEPRNPAARHYYANLLRSLGRMDEALEQHTFAVTLDPLSPMLNEVLAFTLLCAGRPEEALERVDQAIELDSTYWRARDLRGLVYEHAGRVSDAIREYERANALVGGRESRAVADLARALVRADRREEGRRLVATLTARSGNYQPVVATVLYALGDVQGAHNWLEQSYRQRHPGLAFIASDPRFAALENDARFVDLKRRIGLRSPQAAGRGR